MCILTDRKGYSECYVQASNVGGRMLDLVTATCWLYYSHFGEQKNHERYKLFVSSCLQRVGKVQCDSWDHLQTLNEGYHVNRAMPCASSTPNNVGKGKLLWFLCSFVS